MAKHYSSQQGFTDRMGCISERITYADLTLAAGNGLKILDEQLPAGCLVLGWAANIVEAFIGSGTLLMSIGLTGNVDIYTGLAADLDVETKGYVGALAPSDGTDGTNAVASAAADIHVNIVENGGNFSANTTANTGIVDVYLYYIKAIPGVS